jgi:hypothetical protein
MRLWALEVLNASKTVAMLEKTAQQTFLDTRAGRSSDLPSFILRLENQTFSSCLLQASTVLYNRCATVIGPTPPGLGLTAPATFQTSA